MHSIDETPEVLTDWRAELRRQGRSLTWLAHETGITYPMISGYSQGRVKVPVEWIAKVRVLLGMAAA